MNVKYQKHNTLSNCGYYKIRNETHTLGNVIRNTLMRHKDIIFAGYQVPHPLENHMQLTIRTSQNSNPEIVLIESLKTLENETEVLQMEFKQRCKDHTWLKKKEFSRSDMKTLFAMKVLDYSFWPF